MSPRTAATLALLKRIRETERDQVALKVREHQAALDALAARHDALVEDISTQDAGLEDGAAAYRAVWLCSISQEIEHYRAQSECAQIEKDRSTEVLSACLQEVERLNRALDKAAEAEAFAETRRNQESLIEGVLLGVSGSEE